MGVGPLVPAAVRALGQDALALRAGAAVLALHRSHRRSDDDGRRPLLAPALGRRDHRRRCSRCSTTGAARARAAATRPASRCSRWSTTGATRRRASSSTPLGGVGARARTAAAASSAPTSGTTTRNCRCASSRSCTPTSPVARPASGPGSTGPWFQIDAPGHTSARAVPALRASTATSSETDTWVLPHLLPHAAQQRRSRRRAAAALLAVVVRRSTDDDSRRPLLRPHRAGRTQLRLRRRCSSTRATRSARSPSSRRC